MVYKRETNAPEVLPKMIDIATTLMQENAVAFIVLMLGPALRSSSFIIAHTRKRLIAFIVALACSSPALIVPHRRSRSQAPCAHPCSHARECLAFIVDHRRSSWSLIHAQARERLVLIVALACNSPALSSLIGVHRRSCCHASCAHPCSYAHARR